MTDERAARIACMVAMRRARVLEAELATAVDDFIALANRIDALSDEMDAMLEVVVIAARRAIQSSDQADRERVLEQ